MNKRKKFLSIKTKKMFKLLIFIVLAVIVLGGVCKPGPIIPNPNRKLLLSKKTTIFSIPFGIQAVNGYIISQRLTQDFSERIERLLILIFLRVVYGG